MKNRNFGDSFKNALNGIIYTVKNERNMKIHMLAAAGSLFLVFFYRLSGLEAAVICLTVAAVIACELFNTAVEAIVDIIVDVYHPKAKIIKDAAAGAVLVAALLAVLIGYFIFFQRVCGTMDIIMAAAAKMTLWNAAVLFIGAILLTVILKIFIKKSMYLYIKYPDIISALMLFSGVSISFLAGSSRMAVLLLVLSALVIFYRLERKHCNAAEVFTGSLLGITSAVFMYLAVLRRFI